MSDTRDFPWTTLKMTLGCLFFFLPFSLTIDFQQHYFYGETKEAMKNKKKQNPLYFFNQNQFDLMGLFFSFLFCRLISNTFLSQLCLVLW